MAVISRHHEQHADEPSWSDELGSIPLIVTLILPLVIGVVILLKCILDQCCLRKTTAKEEMFGVEGRMTMISTSESGLMGNNNSSPSLPIQAATVHLHRPTSRTDSSMSNNNTKATVPKSKSNPASRTTSLDPQLLPSTPDTPNGGPPAALRQHRFSSTSDSYETHDLTDSLKRSTVHRQLPDLPQGHNPPRRSSSVLSHDGTSELYATVEEVPKLPGAVTGGGSHLYSNIGERSSGPNKPSTSHSHNANLSSGNKSISGSGGKKGEPNPSSDSETYGNSSSHPYAKLKRNTVEHPYARVKTRTGSAEIGGDEAEETDTDNYDVTHPYAQITARAAGGGPSREIPLTSSSAPPNSNTDERPSTSGSANISTNQNQVLPPIRGPSVEAADNNGDNHPVPPRRTGRQWRRSHPQAQGQPQPNSTNDNQVHFSGDSQDSRGYTSISVREPLSNIRNQALPRKNDSHYATVSDESAEEMYAAIEDPSDANYMRIPGDEGRQWQGMSNFERREANSPLPPVPPPLSPQMVSPSEVSPSASNAPARDGPPSPAPPIYAQVSKKNKSKAPTTPTGTTIQSSQATSPESVPTTGTTAGAPSTSTTTAPVKRRHHHAAILDTTPPLPSSSDGSRRWSKADISYSEFDIIREPSFPFPSELEPPVSLSAVPKKSDQKSASGPKPKPVTHIILDEDNYNVIPDVRSNSRISKQSDIIRPHQEDNYQEIESRSGGNHPYQEIPGRSRGPSSSPSDYYQEISEIKKPKKPKHRERDNTYQKIRTKNGEESDDEDEEEEEDQFYEKVKVRLTPSSTTNTNMNLQLPNTNPSARKHGYEKLKRKTDEITKESRVEIVGSDEEEEGSLYEQVKYPPYERLQESRDNLLEGSGDGDNLYEDIGTVVTKSRKSGEEESGSGARAGSRSGPEREAPSPTAADVDLDQLYARVDKTKKKKRTESGVEALGIQPMDYDHDHSIEYI